jgi:hypothetical protein
LRPVYPSLANTLGTLTSVHFTALHLTGSEGKRQKAESRDAAEWEQRDAARRGQRDAARWGQRDAAGWGRGKQAMHGAEAKRWGVKLNES